MIAQTRYRTMVVETFCMHMSVFWRLMSQDLQCDSKFAGKRNFQRTRAWNLRLQQHSFRRTALMIILSFSRPTAHTLFETCR